MTERTEGDEAAGRDGLTRVFERDRPQEPLEMRAALSGLQQRLFGRAPRVLTLARYVLLHRLGGGGGGVVYAGYDPELDRKVAIKLLRARQDTEAADELRTRLMREAQAMAKLAHPNVIAVHDVGSYDESALSVASTLEDEAAPGRGKLEIPARGVFVVMELVDGSDLRKWLTEKPRSVSDIVRVMVAAGRGLAAAHEHGLVHRDFKPTNVLIGRDGRVRVLDFGLARTVGDPEPSAETPLPPASGPDDSGHGSALRTPLTEHGTVMGTPPYMSPEQHRAETADARSDQYGFCIALHEALYGKVPFSAKNLDELAKLKENAELPPPPPDANVPSWLRAIVARGLRPVPADRYASMAHLLADLDRDPGAFKRRLALGAVAAGLFAVVGVAVASADSAAARCPDPADHLQGVWDEPTRARVRQAFSATGLPYAKDALSVVERELDAYTEAWAAGRKDACEAAMVRGEQTPEEMGVRMLCLDRRLEHVAALTRLFVQADGGVVESAVEGVSALEPVDACIDPEAQTPTGIPAQGPRRAALLAIERRLADAEALYRAGHYEEGKGVAEAAVAAARDLEHGPSEARACLILGRLELGAGDAVAAEKRLVEAWVAAERVADHQHATNALVELVRVVGYDQAHPDEAQRYIDLAEAKLAQRDLGDATRARLLRNTATVRWRQGRYDEALPLLEKSLRLYERALGVDHPRVLEVQGSMGAMYASTGQIDRALEILEAILPRLQDLLGPEHPTVAALHQNLGAALDAAGDQARSTEHYRSAVAIFERTVGPDHPSMGAALSNLGTAFFYGGRLEEAAETYARALKIKEAAFGPEHVSVAVTLNNLGAVTNELGDPERALELHLRAFEIRKNALGTDHPEMGQSETNIGLVLHALGRDREALPHVDRALEIFDRLGSREAVLVEPLRARGETLLGLGRSKEAIEALERSVRLATDTGAREFERADSEFALARALAVRDPARAREMAVSARDHYAAAPGRGMKVEKVAKWLENQKP